MKIIIATIKSWNIEHALEMKKEYESIHEIVVYTKKEEFTYENVYEFNPDYILIPHWSYIIPKDITDNWECVVFHMTDLPYGRGGSPLQNLIVRGHRETKISAIKVTQELDGGPIYMKKPLSLEGSATEILKRCSDIIFSEMLPCFLTEKLVAQPQVGEPVIFKRRKESDGELTGDMDLEKIYDYIRMLDAEGYPEAFINFGDYKLSFTAARLDETGSIIEASVKIQKADR